MKLIENKVFGSERSLYGIDNYHLINVEFSGEEDGESALKESKNVIIDNSRFCLRYPLWHASNIEINNSEMTDTCRAALWYSNDVKVKDSVFKGVKIFRECSDCSIVKSEISSTEQFWFCDTIKVDESKLSGEYAFFKSSNININNLDFKGKYSFQYVSNVEIKDSYLDTKDAFWEAENVTVINSVIKGEYLGWYSNNLTLINCHIKGTQPLCYCKNLKIIDCTFDDADLAFENSSVDATIIGSILSIKNPLAGKIVVDDAQIIIDEQNKYNGSALVILRNKEVK